MPNSSSRPRRSALSAPVAPSLRERLNDYAFDRGLAHLDAVCTGRARQLTIGQELVGGVALYYSAGRLLLEGVSLLATKRQRTRRKSRITA